MEIEELKTLAKRYYASDRNREHNLIKIFGVLDYHQDNIEIYKRLGVTESEFYAFRVLCGFGSEYLQSPLALGDAPDPFIAQVIEELDSFLIKNPITHAEILYRQDNYSSVKIFEIGKIITVNYFLTTSIDDFNNTHNIKWIIQPLKDGRSRGHEIFHIYNHANENQVEFERGATFMIDKIIIDNDIHIIYCHEM